MAAALVLSAGGFYGAWQAGAWRVLAEVFHPGMVVGASVGALNGWAIAGGVQPAALTARWLDPRMAEVMRRRLPWPPWKGVFAPQGLEELARELFAAAKPAVPFAATVVEVPQLRARLVRDGEMTWRHLMAACAVPFGYPPVRLDGHWYVDGGLLAAVPLWGAAELGATSALVLNVLPRMPSRALGMGVAALRALAPSQRTRQVGTVVRIAPSEALGSLHDALCWREPTIRRWIELGARDAVHWLSTAPNSDLRAVFD